VKRIEVFLMEVAVEECGSSFSKFRMGGVLEGEVGGDENWGGKQMEFLLITQSSTVNLRTSGRGFHTEEDMGVWYG